MFNLWENVDSIDEGTKEMDDTYVSDLTAMTDMLREMCMHVSVHLLDNCDFALPQKRLRYWFVAVPIEFHIASTPALKDDVMFQVGAALERSAPPRSAGSGEGSES